MQFRIPNNSISPASARPASSAPVFAATAACSSVMGIFESIVDSLCGQKRGEKGEEKDGEKNGECVEREGKEKERKKKTVKEGLLKVKSIEFPV